MPYSPFDQQSPFSQPQKKTDWGKLLQTIGASLTDAGAAAWNRPTYALPRLQEQWQIQDQQKRNQESQAALSSAFRSAMGPNGSIDAKKIAPILLQAASAGYDVKPFLDTLSSLKPPSPYSDKAKAQSDANAGYITQDEATALGNPAPADFTLGDARFSGRTNQPIATAPIRPDFNKAFDPITGAPNTQVQKFEMGLRTAGRPNTTVNVEGQQFGPIPPGQRIVKAPDGSVSMEPIPGSPAALEQAAQKAADVKKQTADAGVAGVIIADVDRIKDIVTRSPWTTTGFVGDQLKGWAGTDARNVDNLLKGIKSNIGFGQLQKMRDASKTGAALGAVQVAELEMLQSAYGALEQATSKDQFIYNLDRVKDAFSRVVDGAPAPQGGQTNIMDEADKILRGGR